MGYLHEIRQHIQPLLDCIRPWGSNNVTMVTGSAVGAAGMWYLWRRYQDRYLPPGPTGWPLIGASYLVRGDSFLSDVEALAKKYGDVFSIQMGSSLMIFMTSHSAIKEALVTQGETFAGRPRIGVLDYLDIHDDIFSIPYESPAWKENKAFLMKCLHGAGFGSCKNTEEKVLEQVQQLTSHLESQNGKSIILRQILPKATINVIFQILYAKSFDYDDPELLHILEVIRNFMTILNEPLFLGDFPNIFMRWWHRKTLARVVESANAFRDIIRSAVEEHLKDYDPENPRDFVEIYLSKKGKEHGIKRVVDNSLFFSTDSTDTMSISIEWILVYITYHQTVQARMFTDIETITKGNRHVTWLDRSQLPYVEAVIQEVIRLTNPSATTAPHCALKETTFRGFRIPKRASLVCLLQSAHKDPRVYNQPNEFNPDRFLDTDGTLKKTDAWIPFGMGRRMCSGEQLTRMEWFLFVANIVQTFKLTFAEGEKVSLEPSEDSVFLQSPKQLRLNLTKRI